MKRSEATRSLLVKVWALKSMKGVNVMLATFLTLL